MRSSGETACLGDLAQRHDRVFVVVAVDGDLGAGRDHPRAVAGEQNEIEAVFDLVDAIFDGDTGHSSELLWRFLQRHVAHGEPAALGIVTGGKRKGVLNAAS